MDQLLEDARHPRQHLEGLVELVRRDPALGRHQLVQHQLHPQLGGLVLHDEQHLVVRRRERALRPEQGIELQVVAVAHRMAEIELGMLVLNDLLGRRRRLVLGHGQT
jgi:hypothetical protein